MDHQGLDHHGARGRDGILSKDTGTLEEFEESSGIHSLTHCPHFGAPMLQTLYQALELVRCMFQKAHPVTGLNVNIMT